MIQSPMPDVGGTRTTAFMVVIAVVDVDQVPDDEAGEDEGQCHVEPAERPQPHTRARRARAPRPGQVNTHDRAQLEAGPLEGRPSMVPESHGRYAPTTEPARGERDEAGAPVVARESR